MATSGVSTLGIKFGYAVETTAGTRPTSGYTVIPRCNNIGAYSEEQGAIDASALEDSEVKYIPGRVDGGGTWPVTFNKTDAVIGALNTMISAYETAEASSLGMWFTVYSPYLSTAEFIKGAPPAKLPLSERSQDSLDTIELNFIVESMENDTAVEPA